VRIGFPSPQYFQNLAHCLTYSKYSLSTHELTSINLHAQQVFIE
jgi:hypothetical protein